VRAIDPALTTTSTQASGDDCSSGFVKIKGLCRYNTRPAIWLTNMAEPYELLRQYTERVQEHMDIWARELI
jgi:hypothetical protein